MHVKSHTDPAENILAYRPWQASRGIDGAWQPVEADARVHNAGFIAQFAGVTDPDAAAAWRGASIGVDAAVLPAPAEDEYYWADLVGLRVVGCDGDDLGCVERLFSTPAHDVLVVRDADDEHLVPFVRRVVEAVEPTAGRIVVDWRRDWRI